MRITFVVGLADLSGGFRVIATFAKRLRERGHEVLVVSRPRRSPKLRERVRAMVKRLPQPPDPQREVSHMDGTGVTHRLLETYRPILAADVPDGDVVIATWWESAEWVDALPASKGAKVHFIQDYETWTGSVDRVDATCRLPFTKITPAGWVKELLETRFANRDVTLVPNSVDLVNFTAPPRGKQPHPTVGLTYTPFPNKGCDVSTAAIRLARQVLPDLKVVAFGSTMPTDEMPLPEGTDFTFRAAEAKLKEIYGRADVWLFGTRKEGFGLPILEAMACRTPVIGTPAGAAPELIARGGGTLVPMEDPQAMADEIVRLARMSDADWRALSDRAFATANRYTWDDALDLFEAVLKRAAAAPKLKNAG
jgi:glycosyltransferase involved in cell wall biosynthesis